MSPEIDWTEKLKIMLSLRELSLAANALDTYGDVGEAAEDEVECNLDALAQRLRTTPANTALELTRDEIRACGLALECHLYWEVSDPQDRNDGHVFFENDPACPNGKMDRERDPVYVEECREVSNLSVWFTATAMRNLRDLYLYTPPNVEPDPEPEPEVRECAFCGAPADEGNYCSKFCARADESDRA